jgi:hypothetical protein
MSICPPNLAHSIHTICEIITFQVDKEAFFVYAKEEQQSLKAQKTTFMNRHGLYNILFSLLGE